MVTYQNWKREEEGLKELRACVDLVCREIVEGKFPAPAELDLRIEAARELCRKLFPDRMAEFDLIYGNRFQRLWEQFGPGGK